MSQKVTLSGPARIGTWDCLTPEVPTLPMVVPRKGRNQKWEGRWKPFPVHLGPAFRGLWSFPVGRSKLFLWARSSPILVLKALLQPLNPGPWLGFHQLVFISVGMSQALPWSSLGLSCVAFCLCVCIHRKQSSSKPAWPTAAQLPCSLTGIPCPSPHSDSTPASSSDRPLPAPGASIS